MLSGYISGIVALLLLTCFLKILVTFSIVRVGLGLDGFALGAVSVALALAFSLLIFEPELSPNAALKALEQRSNNPSELEQDFRPFLEKHTDPDLIKRVSLALRQNGAKTQTQDGGNAKVEVSSPATPWGVLVSCFMISEVRAAFALGIVLLLPFFIIDLLVLNIFGLFSLSGISHQVVAIPLKLMMFVALDGWGRISETLLRSYAG